ncbi:GPCR, family 2, diuretic hormone receptor,GPCR, family 2, extracellular hormone receptor domain,GPCR [Cinara cedri]|uniref:GPCR, family 2, diuretic hormone receptor,GPCR, family 2, extracellular hormone receptor domain,GPCR n=1 Tax=Cinara cedri TaxID=506608 RepID=A0A5E4MP47_9HEMI|nr:GPCR, family 2, diuretic hormone receptor,GPCR, family 2, extracellular hormone receptor domain,GPCR [Cinara cedri]
MAIINETTSWSPPQEEKCWSFYEFRPDNWTGCNASSDTLMCWPATLANTTISQPCFKELNGILYDSSNNASRTCFQNSSWSLTNYSNCTILYPSPANVAGTDDTINVILSLYTAGHCLSLIMTALAIFVFCWFKELKCLRNKIHTNLMASYFVADLIWLLTYTNLTDTNAYKCALLVWPLYYFTMTNYFWAFIEGLYLFILVVDTFFLDRLQLRTYLGIGWGIPLVVASIWGMTKVYVPTTQNLDVYNETTHKKSCVLMTSNGIDWIYVIPIIVVLFINLLYLLKIMWVLITKIRSTNTTEIHRYKKAAKALLVLIPLLGLAFCLDFIDPRFWNTDYKLLIDIFCYGRVVITSTQGFNVSLLYCFFNHEVQNTLKDHIIRWKEKRRFIAAREKYGQSWLSQKNRNICHNMGAKEPWIPVENSNGRSSSCISNTTTSSAMSTTKLLNTTIEIPDDTGYLQQEQDSC